jgi:hypothetical protein
VRDSPSSTLFAAPHYSALLTLNSYVIAV